MYSFFAFLNRMKYIQRWSLMRSTDVENISQHSQQVAMIGHSLAVINNVIFDGDADPDRVCALAVFHEATEVITGDLPTPIKYFNVSLNSAYKELEEMAADKLLGCLPEELRDYYQDLIKPDTSSYEHKLLKAADKIAALIKCIDEEKSGNTEFLKAKTSIQKQIAKFNIPEVKYFLDNFLDAFYLSLDELSEE
ncbi:MAG TPA: 5'-deoxynucleotidase [Clostridiales bacterium]|nr:5'-deoxynucleotidase [Clostridiales bacterium]